jgi:hypothetical protein
MFLLRFTNEFIYPTLIQGKTITISSSACPIISVGSDLSGCKEKKEKPYTKDVLASTTMNDVATCDKR